MNDPAGDYMAGDPAHRVIGKPEEQPAREHAPLPPKRPPVTARTILADIRLRRQELEPLAEEHQKLEAAYNAIKDI